MDVEQGFHLAVRQPGIAKLVENSVGLNFGSQRLPSGVVTWPKDKAVPARLLSLAAEVFAFDVLPRTPTGDVTIRTCSGAATRFTCTTTSRRSRSWRASSAGSRRGRASNSTTFGTTSFLNNSKELETKQVLARLQPKRIVAKDYDHEFDHAWNNGVWNLFQPVSMDLLDADSILDKANRWLGRATNLKDSQDKFRLWMLIGEPRIEKLKPAYGKALNILNKMPVKKDFVTEHDAQKFSEQLAQEMTAHPASE